MLYGGVSSRHIPAPLNFSRSIKDANPRRPAPRVRREDSLQLAQRREKIVPTSPSFSISSALFPKIAQLIENTRQTASRNPIHFYQFRTPLHSFPGSPVVSAFYELHTGGVGYRVLIAPVSRDPTFQPCARSLAPSINYNPGHHKSRGVAFLPLCESLRSLRLCVIAFLACDVRLLAPDVTSLRPSHQSFMGATT
jgi:hypothetical protein